MDPETSVAEPGLPKRALPGHVKIFPKRVSQQRGRFFGVEHIWIFGVEKSDSEAFPLTWARAIRWQPPERLKYLKIWFPPKTMIERCSYEKI